MFHVGVMEGVVNLLSSARNKGSVSPKRKVRTEQLIPESLAEQRRHELHCGACFNMEGRRRTGSSF
jgi:hypothetical protein